MSGWRRSAVVTLGVAGVLTFGTGVALGYYNASIATTSVTATAAGGTVVLEARAASTDALWPGGPAADVTATVRNPFPKALTVDRLTATASGCAQPDLRTTQPPAFTVPAGASATVVLADVVALGPGASADCQGADLVVRYTVSGTL